MIQGSDEWVRARLGKATASRIADAVAKIKTGWGKSRDDYLNELVFERINGVPVPQYQSADMLNGTMREPEARAAYIFECNIDVVEVGFLPHPAIPMAGCSPDGLVGDDGLIEIKCPKWSTHQETLLYREIPDRYMKQMQFQLAVTGRAWCDYISYSPQWREDLRLKIIRVPRDDKMITYLEAEVSVFLHEVDKATAALEGMIKRAAA
jgi:putative phage-type endonuclease